jgi:hypothetical protein
MCVDEGAKLPGLSRCQFCPSRSASVGAHASTGVFSNTALLMLVPVLWLLLQKNIVVCFYWTL